MNSNIFKIELILNDCFCNINFLVTLSISDKLINKKDIQFIQDVLNELKNNMYNNLRNLDDMEKKLMKIQNIFLELTEITKYFGNKKNLMWIHLMPLMMSNNKNLMPNSMDLIMNNKFEFDDE